jgi:hypothetical protein
MPFFLHFIPIQPKEPSSSSHQSQNHAARVAEFLSLSYPTPIIVTPPFLVDHPIKQLQKSAPLAEG